MLARRALAGGCGAPALQGRCDAGRAAGAAIHPRPRKRVGRGGAASSPCSDTPISTSARASRSPVLGHAACSTYIYIRPAAAASRSPPCRRALPTAATWTLVLRRRPHPAAGVWLSLASAHCRHPPPRVLVAGLVREGMCREDPIARRTRRCGPLGPTDPLDGDRRDLAEGVVEREQVASAGAGIGRGQERPFARAVGEPVPRADREASRRRRRGCDRRPDSSGSAPYARWCDRDAAPRIELDGAGRRRWGRPHAGGAVPQRRRAAPSGSAQIRVDATRTSKLPSVRRPNGVFPCQPRSGRSAAVFQQGAVSTKICIRAGLGQPARDPLQRFLDQSRDSRALSVDEYGRGGRSGAQRIDSGACS